MQAFYDTILNDTRAPILSEREIYIENVKQLYFPRANFRDPRIAQHIEFLLAREPTMQLVPLSKWEQEMDEKYGNVTRQTKMILSLTKEDIEISRILKSDCRGLSITISPTGDINTWQALLTKFKTIKCPHIKSGYYYIEFFTNGHTNGRPHIHFYCKLKEYSRLSISRVRAYYTQIFKKGLKANVACFKKPDISYGLNYLTATDSSLAKQRLKDRDADFRKENNIDSIFYI